MAGVKDDEKIIKEVNQSKVKIPSYVGQTITSVLVFLMAATTRGNTVSDTNSHTFLTLVRLFSFDL